MESKEWPLQTALKVRDVVAERAWDLPTSQANLPADGSETGMRMTQCDFRHFTAIHRTEWQRSCTFFSPLVQAKIKHLSLFAAPG